jgi:hypothetical protein
MLHYEQAKHCLSGGRMPTVHQRERIALGQVRPHLLVELVVLQQSVELLEHGIGLRR